MKVALILEPDIIDDLARRGALVEALRQTPGVLSVDDETADSGLLFANVTGSLDAQALERLDGVERVSQLGTKHTAAGC